MKFITFIIIILLISSCEFYNALDYPPKNINIRITKIKLYKGFIFANDTLLIGSGYFKESKSFDTKKDGIYGNLLVGDSLITGMVPEKYIIRIRNNVPTKYYWYSEQMKSNNFEW